MLRFLNPASTASFGLRFAACGWPALEDGRGAGAWAAGAALSLEVFRAFCTAKRVAPRRTAPRRASRRGRDIAICLAYRQAPVEP
jgi:hypothetical protein